jgi:para-nitrobenzyl esterase
MNAGVTEAPVSIEVRTSAGVVRGYRQDGIANFRGIPYGATLDGQQRFTAPQPIAAWSGVRDARTTGPRAVQPFGNLFQTRTGDYYSGGRVGELGLNDQRDSENCLVLNVLTPDTVGGRPVMVYLHGGGFREGSGVIGVAAQRLALEQDVVVVSVNHRLNVFGFLYLGDLDPAYADSGNASMLDLVLALEWVRDNASAFGGDPANVTIFGESGGGAKVSTLLAMPAAHGLFKRAIVQSGVYPTPRTRDEATADARTVLSRLAIPESELHRLLEVDAAELFAVADGLRFGPVLDGRALPESPFESIAPAVSADVALMVGHCEDEMNWLSAGDESVYWLDEPEVLSRLETALNQSHQQVQAIVDAYRAVLPGATPSELYLRITTDAYFGRAAIQLADLKSLQPAPVFRYLFSYDTPVEGGRYGAFHTAELPLIFRLVDYPEMEELSRQVSAQWAAFARTGEPRIPGLAWPRYDLEERSVMVLDKTSRVVPDAQKVERQLWEQWGTPTIDRLVRQA